MIIFNFFRPVVSIRPKAHSATTKKTQNILHSRFFHTFLPTDLVRFTPKITTSSSQMRLFSIFLAFLSLLSLSYSSKVPQNLQKLALHLPKQLKENADNKLLPRLEDDVSSEILPTSLHWDQRGGAIPVSPTGGAATMQVPLPLPVVSPKIPSISEDAYTAAVFRTTLAIGSALVFGAGLFRYRGLKTAQEFFAGYLVEQSLSVDNLFVFIMLFDYFRVPVNLQERVLNYGVIGAIVMRGGECYFFPSSSTPLQFSSHCAKSISTFTSFRKFFSPTSTFNFQLSTIVPQLF